MITDIIVAYLLQVGFTLGVIFVFGWLISVCNKIFYSNFGMYGTAICYVTGAIGTPVHELSHALFCLIFGHKIDEIQLFQISGDGTLGYVNHSYNKKNIYHRIGNFFIGIAPIIVISTILYLLSLVLLPSYVESIEKLSYAVLSFDGHNILVSVKKIVGSFFGAIGSWQWWDFMVVRILLALHSTLSGADIKGMFNGLWFLLFALLIVDVVLRIVSKEYFTAFTQYIISFGTTEVAILSILLSISVVALVISFIFKYGKKIK